MPVTFSPPPTSKETVMHVGIANLRWRGNRSRYPSACATHNFTYLARGPYFPRHCLRRMLWNLPDWCYVDIGSYNGLGRQAISDYLNQCWPISPTPYGVTKPQRLLVYDILSQWNLQKLFTRNFSLPNWSIEYFASTHIHLPRMFLSTGFLLKKTWIGQVSSGLLYTSFT